MICGMMMAGLFTGDRLVIALLRLDLSAELLTRSLVIYWCAVMGAAAAAGVREKAEAVEPIPSMSPPEGNTTFIDGRTWCVARPGASQFDLENAIAWACGLGGADCSAVQPGAACYKPDTLLAHASFAFNSYYQQNGNSDVACYFGGTAAITTRDPSN